MKIAWVVAFLGIAGGGVLLGVWSAQKGVVSSPDRPALAAAKIEAALSPSAVEMAKQRALNLEAKILRIRGEGVHVDYRVAIARLEDAQRARDEGPGVGDTYTANSHAVEACRLAAIDEWYKLSEQWNEVVTMDQITKARSDGVSVEVDIAKARLARARRTSANSERAQEERRKGGPYTLTEPTRPWVEP